MAHTLTKLNEFWTDELTTTPVILRGELGRDYILIRRATSSTNVYIGRLVVFLGAGTVDVAGDNASVNGIVPDTPFNRMQLEKDTGSNWSYNAAFANGTLIDIAVPINNIIVRAVWLASSGNVDVNTGLECGGSGKVKVQEQNGRLIGKSLSKVTSGTGDAVIAMVLYGSAVTEVVKA